MLRTIGLALVLFPMSTACCLERPDASSSEQHEYVRRLWSPAIAKGFIGGEAHDTYVVRARKGQTMTVRLSWLPERDPDMGDNKAQFWVSSLPDFDGNGDVKFGKESHHGKSWTGVIPRTADYYIYVIGHPVADYKLRVTVHQSSRE
jgi:hypothetical protein